MWREGPNKMRVCNACGIRWQKYGYHCSNCHAVPTKKQAETGSCPRCKHALGQPSLSAIKRNRLSLSEEVGEAASESDE